MDIDLYSDVGAICPYCRTICDASDGDHELYDGRTFEWSCFSCGKDFYVTVAVSISWQTEAYND